MLKRTLRYTILVLTLLLLTSINASAADNKEYLIKAAFIYNFVKFVEWPGDEAINKKSSIDICIIGDTPLSQTSAVFKAASTQKLSLVLVDEKNWHKADSHCHIIFIGESEAAHLPDIFAALQGHPVLTVSDIDDFVDRGGMIGFVMQDNKVKLEVNPKTVTAAGLRIDAQLLEIASKVVDK